jgi:hypothetical protein
MQALLWPEVSGLFTSNFGVAAQSSVIHQRTDRHEIVGEKPADFNSIRAHGLQSVRRLATRTRLSKSSVHRHTQAMAATATPSREWRSKNIQQLIVRVSGVGAETISEFFGRLRLEAHSGCSPSALRGTMEVLEAVMALQEQLVTVRR